MVTPGMVELYVYITRTILVVNRPGPVSGPFLTHALSFVLLAPVSAAIVVVVLCYA